MNAGRASDAPAADLAEANSPDSSIDRASKIAAIEAEMRSGNFDQRQAVMMRLWADHGTYRDWVENAVHDPDVEVARRAKWVLDRWRRGLLPGTPREITDRIESVDGPEAIENLLNAGLFEGALVAIDEVIGGATSPAIIDRAESAIRRRFPFYIRVADERNQLPALISLLERLAMDATMSRSFHQLSLLAGHEQPSDLMTGAARLTAAQKQRLAIILRAANNELGKATQLAEKNSDPELLRVCRMLSGDWQILAREQLSAARSQPPDSVDWYRHWMYAMVAASRCDELSIREQAFQRLSESRGIEKDADAKDQVNRLRWQTLAIHGEMDAAIKILKPLRNKDAAELLAQGSRFTEAFEALGMDWRDLDSQMRELIDDTVSAERSFIAGQIPDTTPQLARLLAAIRLLVSTGRDDLAFQSLKNVVNHPSLRAQEEATTLRSDIMRVLWRINRTDWIHEFLVGPKDKSLSGQSQFILSMAFDAKVETVAVLIDAMGQLNPASTFAQRVRDTVKFLGGTVPVWFNPKNDFNRLYQALLESRNASRNLTRNDPVRVRLTVAPRLSTDIARLFELHGQSDLALKTITELSTKYDDIEAKLKLAELELDSGSVQAARQMFKSIWNSLDAAGQNISRLNQADSDALIAMKAIFGEANAATRLGDIEGAADLNRQIKMMLCTPSSTLLNSFAEYLVERGMNEMAEIILAPLLSLAAFGATEGVEFYTIAHNYDSAVAMTKPAEAAAALDLAIAGTVESTSFYPAAYVSVPSYTHRRKIRAAVENRDEPEARKEVEKLLRLDPVDIDFGEKVLGPMRKNGMTDLANEVLEKMYQAGNSHLEKFPLDVGMANNLAWVLSLSDYRLDESLRFSKNAVFYEPDSTVYRDTLAEVLFRLKRKDEAIAIEKACLLDDPSEWHVHEQIRRFESTKSP